MHGNVKFAVKPVTGPSRNEVQCSNVPADHEYISKERGSETGPSQLENKTALNTRQESCARAASTSATASNLEDTSNENATNTF